MLGCSAEATGHEPGGQAGAAAGTQDAGQTRIAGTVLETLDVPNYTYIRLETAAGEAWAAVPQAAVEVGSQVAIVNVQTMVDFKSNSLERTFETIYFGTLEGQGGAPAMGQGGAPAMARGGASPHGTTSPHGSAAVAASDGPIEVARAEGANGRTIAEIYSGKEDLAGKSVAIRGKVVKYNAGIMGRNWIHLQDGSGDPAAGTHDITVTTADSTAMGEVIVIEGKLSLDIDFGSGYRYDVIVEEASVR
jgi:hypothetical protein